jgi:periplasmic divalent cation tolerance protein
MSDSVPPAEIIYTTTDNAADAERLAAALVTEQRAACVQIDGPIRSVYCWEGRQETSREWRLMIKTTASAAEAACRWLASEHPYDEPEIVRLPVVGGSETYLRWIASQVRV